MLHSMIMAGGNPIIPLTISANTADYNVFVAAGSPSFAADIVLTVNTGIYLYSTSTATPALSTGVGWVVGSTIKLINNGNVFGMGGAGAEGGNPDYYQGQNGVAGGPAMGINWNIIIDNTNGLIGGGGGGGGGGGAGWWIFAPASFKASGGGGGGGQGYNGGAAGIGGYSCLNNYGTCVAGANGVEGTAAVAGGGGAGGVVPGWCQAGNGGGGGGLGAVGAAGMTGVSGNGVNGGGAGGAAGKAINLNGFVITWLGGNNANQVKGIVS